MKYQVKVDGKVFEVEVEKVGGGYQSLQAGSLNAAPAPAPVPQAAPAPAPAPQAAPAPAAPAASGGSNSDIISPMPGKVLKLIASDGAHVEAGDVVLILEAMKMENEIVAPVGGTLRLKVSAGQTVDTDALLASIE